MLLDIISGLFCCIVEIMIELALTGLTAACKYSLRKLVQVANAFPRQWKQRHETVDGFLIADTYPPQPRNNSA